MKPQTTASRSRGIKRAICPACGTNYGVPLLWGDRSEHEKHQVERGNVVLGGTTSDNSAFDHHCRRCCHRWVGGKVSTVAITLPMQSLSPSQDDQASTTVPTQVPSTSISPLISTAHEENLKPDCLTRPVTIWPSVAVFFIAWLVSLALVGEVVCSDGWASGSIGRRGACSNHGSVNRLPPILALFAAALIAFKVHSLRERWAARKLTMRFTEWLFKHY